MRWQRDNSPVLTVGSRAWFERLQCGAPPNSAAEQFNAAQEAMRPFMSRIGRRGAHERSRNYARRNLRKRIRFWQRYECNPNKVAAAPVKATPEQRRYLRAYASRGGRARSARLNHEERAAIAAKGGRAKAEKAAKLKRAAICASDVAAKHPKE
jgi:hypothetical protein